MKLTFNCLLNLFVISLSAAYANTDDMERQALIDFYHSTEGPSWIRQDNWLSETLPHCEWHGVICDENQQVIEIQLFDNGLSGYLPESLGNLKKLKMCS